MARIAAMICCWLAAIAPTGVTTTIAADYPAKPIRLVVGFAAGGPTDIPARFVADKLGDKLGQRVFVENKPIAAGMVATRDVLSQPRDGYTLLLCTHFEAINTAFYTNLGFKLDDITPVSLIAEYYYALALSLRVPAEDFMSFVQYVKLHPGEVSYATIGAGSAQEILARQLEKLAGITMNRIPFRGGPQVVQEMLAGRVDFYVSPTLAVVPQYESKQLRLLAISAPERLPKVPKVPTLKEAGINYVRFGWLGICAAEGTPQPIIDRLNREVVSIVAMPEYTIMIKNAGSIAISSTPEQLGQVIKQTLADVAATVQEFGLQQER
jgi:tripartite-type tricarboxylate transporter receptor subunit TctC